MGVRKFSVGKIFRDGVQIGVAKNIAVNYDSGSVQFRGGDHRYPLNIVAGDQTLTITAETADFDITEPVFGVTETLQLAAGANGGGVISTFTNMVLVKADVTSSQNEFVATSLEWMKQDVEV